MPPIPSTLAMLQNQAVHLKTLQSTPALLTELQIALQQLGLYLGKADGLWGSNTAIAIQQFCQRKGLTNYEREWFGADFYAALAQSLGTTTITGTKPPASSTGASKPPIPTTKPAIGPAQSQPLNPNPSRVPGEGSTPRLGLTRDDFKTVAASLDIPVASLRAIVSVEASGSGFWQDGRPKMRYERHIFHQQTQGRFSSAYPDVSNAQRGGSTTGPSEYTRLKQAMALDYLAALRSASWGLPQIMGFNFNLAGFSNVEAMVWAMHQSEANQLKAMGAFLASTNIVAPLRIQDWVKVARLYNGSNYQANRYDEKLALAYNQAVNEGWA